MKLLYPLNRKDGMTLIEILIALVVFTIGILAVVRIFPPGFGILNQTKNTTITERLTQLEIERLKGSAENLPSAILPGYPDPGTGEFIFVDTDPMILGDSIPGGHTDVNKMRYVYEESTKIPVPKVIDPATQDSGSFYVLNFSPISGPVTIYSGPMRRVAFPSAIQNLSLPTLSDYSIDHEDRMGYNDGKVKLCLRSATVDRSFAIKYSYWTQDAPGVYGLHRVPRNFTVLAATADEQAAGYQLVDVPGMDTTTMAMEVGSDSLHRAFKEQTGSWTDDPYEYKLYDELMGVVVFNPRGYHREEVTERGTEPLIAYISYYVMDWHILHDERKVPIVTESADARLKVRLSLGSIKKRGFSTNYDGTKYNGITGAYQWDVIVVDTQDGWHYGIRYNTDNTPEYDYPVGWDTVSGSTVPFTVDYKEGIVRFDPYFSGRTVRVYYRVGNDWAINVSKPCSVFTPVYTLPAVPWDAWDAYHVFSDTTNPDPLYKDNTLAEIAFAKCQNGNSVSVDYAYRLVGEPADAREHFVSGEVYQIAEDDNSANYCIKLMENLKKRGVDPDELASIRVINVYGVSVGVKSIRRDIGSKNLRWKTADLDTYLTRNGK